MANGRCRKSFPDRRSPIDARSRHYDVWFAGMWRKVSCATI